MRTLTDVIGVAGAHGATEQAGPFIELQDLSQAIGDPAQAEVEHGSRRSPVSSAVRIISLMAFGQSLLFLVIWLLICASAGAAPTKREEFNADLQLSAYQPTKQRDPLSKSGVVVTETRTTEATPSSLQLDGILYQASNPAAIVNGHLLELNKIVTFTDGGSGFPVKALVITRDHVVVEVNGRQVELRTRPPADAATSQ